MSIAKMKSEAGPNHQEVEENENGENSSSSSFNVQRPKSNNSRAKGKTRDDILKRFPRLYSRWISRNTNERQKKSGTKYSISELDTMLKGFQVALNLFFNIFDSVQVQKELHYNRETPSTVNSNSTEQVVPITPNSTADNRLQRLSSQRNQSSDESRQNSNNISKNEVFNRSGDNVPVRNNRRNSYNKAMKAIAKLNNDEVELAEPIAPSFTADDELQGSSSLANQTLDETSENEEFNRSSDNVLITNNVLISNNNTINENSMQNNESIEQGDERLQGSSSQSNQFLDESAQNSNSINENKEVNRSGDDVSNTSNANTMQNNEAVEQEWVPIGNGNTKIQKKIYDKINWESYTHATRTLLLTVFGRKVLATHSLTGKPSPAFQDKPAKMRLDRSKVSDVIIEVVKKSKVRANRVRNTITIKCADECKMLRTRCKKIPSKIKKNEGNLDGSVQ